MIEKWNYFVYDLCEAKKKDVDEDSFHTLIETQLQHLGWAKFKGEICHKPNIHIGNNNRIEPDILIKRDGEDEFVIEVKRPSHKQSKKDVEQLLSYMRLLKLSVGIYMGEHIEIFYDMPSSKEAVPIMKVPLEIDNKLGARFIDKFLKDNFSRKAIVDFCEERIQEIQRQNSLNEIKETLIADAQTQIAESLKPYLKKGTQICVDGHLKQDKWQKDGQNFSKVSIVADNVQLLGGGKKDGSATSSSPKQQGFDPADGFPEDVPF